MDPNVSAVVLLVGLAVGVDYSLFYLKREREERAAGRSAARRARGRRGDVRPLGADLGRHGDDRDGRDALLRRQDVPVVRRRDDDRRRRSRCSARSPCCPALLSKLGDQVEKGRIPFLDRLRRERRREPVLVGDPHPGAPAPADRRGDRRRGAAARARRRRCCSSTPRSPGSTRCRTARRRSARSTRIQDAFPGGAEPALVAVKARRRLAAVRSTRSPSSKREALASGSDARPDRGRRQRRRTRSPAIDDPARGQGHGRDVERSARDAARTRSLPATVGKVAGRDVRGHRRHGGLGRRERAAEALGCRSCSASCSPSRSCCCWSRSARS